MEHAGARPGVSSRAGVRTNKKSHAGAPFLVASPSWLVYDRVARGAGINVQGGSCSGFSRSGLFGAYIQLATELSTIYSFPYFHRQQNSLQSKKKCRF
jgi:hypothetical protein